jgi:prepilin-type N-terminal cleavage/methylation domain-containing protein
MKERRAFTLIELLVVIAAIAVLSVIVILTLNPAELLRQARDSSRTSDLATLRSALILYLKDASSPNLGTSGKCYTSLKAGTTLAAPTSSAGGAITAGLTDCRFWLAQSTTSSFNISSSRAIDGTGWIPVNFNQISSGAPIGSLPLDGINTTGTASASGNFFSYEATSSVFKLGAFMESAKYKNGGAKDVVSTDGGVNNYIFEQGSSLLL